VIGLGRLLLAILYLIAIAADANQPARAPVAAYALLTGFVAFATITVALTWNDWWLDAKIAGAAHAIDILFFTLLVLLTEGYTSPFFAFFMFVLLSAAIRWGWRSTALTSLLLILLYLIAGMIAARSSPEIELQNFAVRTGHLLILSLILIWFGASRWGLHARSGSRALLIPPSPDQSPIESALRAVMAGVKAESGAFLWRPPGDREFTGYVIRAGEQTEIELPGRAFERAALSAPFLYDIDEGRCLTKDSERNLIERDPADHIDPGTAARLGLGQGLAVPVRSADGEGEMFLDGVRGLSTDHIDLGEQLAADIAAHVQAHALLMAADERAEARSRLMLARDLHDGVVQFLAGTAFRLEAMRRSNGTGRDLAPEIDELKQLILHEQDELRYFITALRARPPTGFEDLVRDLRALAERLSRHWNVRCTLSAEPSDSIIPARIQLDAQHLVREAVANAVRHAEARSITISVAAAPDSLRLEIVNAGIAPPVEDGQLKMPKSLMERVEQSGGTLDFARGMNLTRVSITLPIVARRP
jgi:signal transduction histidine kinase